MNIRNFWPLDFDQEVEIYENPSWDMPGLKRAGRTLTRKTGRKSVRGKK